MKKILAFLAVISISGTLFAQDWLLFEDSSTAFTAKYPPTWTKKIRPDGVVVFKSPISGAKDNFQENINVILRKNPLFTKDFDLKEVLPSITNELKSSMTDFKQNSIRYFKWNGLQAVELKYTVTSKTEDPDSPLRLEMMQWICSGDGVFYTATYSSLQDINQFDAEALQLLQGIRFR